MKVYGVVPRTLEAYLPLAEVIPDLVGRRADAEGVAFLQQRVQRLIDLAVTFAQRIDQLEQHR